MDIKNHTPFQVDRMAMTDRDGHDLLVLVLKATFALNEEQTPLSPEDQQPIHLADTYHGEPGESSVEYAADWAFDKRHAEFAVVGEAYPHPRLRRENRLSVQFGDLEKTVHLFGKRVWKKSFGFWKPSDPEPFESVPLRYELAFGGTDRSHDEEKHHGWENRNPVGTGFRAKHSRHPIEGALLPQFEYPDQLLKSPDDRPEPAGFGFLAPNWQPRVDHAGTYDERWQKERLPLLPEDFSSEHFDAVAPNQLMPFPMEGEQSVVLTGFTADNEPLALTVPQFKPQCRLARDSEDPSLCPLDLMRLTVNTQARWYSLTYLAAFPVAGPYLDITELLFYCEGERVWA